MPEGRGPDEIAALVADGLDIDWDAALQGAPDEQRRLLEQLRLLSNISRSSGFPSSQESIDDSSHWGPFDLVEELDRGSYGRVYRARDTRVDRDVAVKLLPGGGPQDTSGIDEARALAKVRHPNVVAVHGADRFDDIPGLWTELVEGQTLEQMLRAKGTLGAREAVLIGVDLCAALSAVHAAGLVHRDVNARNVMRERGGRIVLLDFGGVQSQAAGQEPQAARVTGTPLYMAPELLAGEAASPQSDIYALGVLLFLLVTRRYPVAGPTLSALRQAHRDGTRLYALDVRPELSPALAQVIDRALAARPEDRYASAGQMRRLLVRALDVGAPPSTIATSRSRGQGLPVPLVVTLVAVAALAGAAATAALFWQRTRTDAGEAPRVVQLTDDQWSILHSYRDLADTASAGGDWSDAALAYDRASQVFSGVYGPNSSPAAVERARAAYSFASKPATPGSRRWNVSTPRRSTSSPNMPARDNPSVRRCTPPARSTTGGTETSLMPATSWRAPSRFRERLFRTENVAGGRASAMGFSHEQLASQLRGRSPDVDADGDWLPDVIELATGLDPSRQDSDGDGARDDEEDTDGDGVANGLEWGLCSNPTNSYGAEGTSDPLAVGARWHSAADRGLSRPSPDGAWRIEGPLVAY